MKHWWWLAFVFGCEWGALAAEPSSATKPPKGMVRSFQGLLQLEQDPTVPDEVKVESWNSFIRRTQKQLSYAEKAAAHWRDADRIRWLEAARAADRDPAIEPRQRISQWQVILEKYPRSEAVAEARSRLVYWQKVETRRLVQAAEEVESSGRPKVDRIQVWRSVQLWAPESREGRAASQRIAALQHQLVREAESVEKIDRIAAQTKLEAWEDVLRGQPTAAQISLAKKKVAQWRIRVPSR